MNSKRFFALLLALVMMFALAACGGETNTEKPVETDAPAAPATDPAEEQTEAPTEAEPAGIVYTVTLTDEGGNPLTGVMVQMCEGTNCVPKITDGEGKAVFTVDKEADYEVKVSAMPEGYDYTTEEHVFYFAAGSKEMTIVLKAIA